MDNFIQLIADNPIFTKLRYIFHKYTYNEVCKELREAGLIEFYSRLDLLVIDEVGVQFGSDTEKMFMFDIIDGRYQEMKPTILISNLAIEGIKKLMGERIIDRLREDGGKAVSFDWPSYRS